MHFSISTFDYLIIKINNTKGIVNKVEEINNFFSTISEDNSYPAIVSVGYNRQNNVNKVCNVYDSISHNKINSVVEKNNGITSVNYIMFNLIQSNKVDEVDDVDEIDEIEDRNANFILNKKFLSCINERDEITFHIFESFMLIKDEDSNLMLSFEQDWSEDDV